MNAQPGKSARYSGDNATNESNNFKLLKALDGVYEKEKHAIDALLYKEISRWSISVITSGSWEGYITEKLIGANSFGYDPLFYLPEYDKTSADFIEFEKKISHRAKALKKLEDYFNK